MFFLINSANALHRSLSMGECKIHNANRKRQNDRHFAFCGLHCVFCISLSTGPAGIAGATLSFDMKRPVCKVYVAPKP